MNSEKDRAQRRLFIRLIEYEGMIRKQSCEVNTVRREKQFFQDLSNKLQHPDRMHCLERIAFVQPIRFNKFREIPSRAQNFSAISILFNNQDQLTAKQVRRLYYSMPEVKQWQYCSPFIYMLYIYLFNLNTIRFAALQSSHNAFVGCSS